MISYECLQHRKSEVVVLLPEFVVLYRDILYWALDVGVVFIFMHPICYRARYSIMYVNSQLKHVPLFLSCVTLSRDLSCTGGPSSICVCSTYKYLYQHSFCFTYSLNLV
jgi:hypothetical protein